MRKLLGANFLRLWRNKAFWVSLAVCVVLGVVSALGEFRFQMSIGVNPRAPEVAASLPILEGQFFAYASFIGILAAAFIPLFFGTEHSEGTLRNKIVVGHSRTAVYLANLLTGFAVSLGCVAGYMLSCLAVGVPLLGWFVKPAALLFAAAGGSVVMLAAFCAIFNFVAMNCSKKSSAVLLCLLGTFIALIVAAVCYNLLEEPEFVSGYELSVAGQIVQSEPTPNPLYLTGTKRAACQFLLDLLPTGQSIQFCSLQFGSPVWLMGLSAAVTAVFTAAGAALFQRKDLK